MAFPLITFFVALTIAIIAAWFSIAGLMAIFSASALSVAIMAGSLEIGKLVAASWVYRNWKRAPFLLKGYLAFATIVLMFITSMGIFGFLSKAHLEQSAQTSQSSARIERIENDITRSEIDLTKIEARIASLDTESQDDTSNIQAQIDAEQKRMDGAYSRIQPAIDELNAAIKVEQTKSNEQVATYLKQLENVNESISILEGYVKSNDVEALQRLVGTQPDGRYGPNTANAVEEYRVNLTADKERISDEIERLRNSVDQSVIDSARAEIKSLRASAEREVQNSQDTIDRLRQQLQSSLVIDNTAEIEALRNQTVTIQDEIDLMLDQKFELETEIRVLEAEVGPIKYIAELVYGDTGKDTIDSAVRWLIIVFIFVFDPLAVLLLLAANYSFVHRHDHETRQEEIFETLFKKEEPNKPEPEPIMEKVEEEMVEEKQDPEPITIDSEEKISDNVIVEESNIEEKPAEEPTEVDMLKAERDNNTAKVLKNSWLNIKK